MPDKKLPPPKGKVTPRKDNTPPARKEERTGIIRAVNTPLGFFALIVLVVEAIIGATTVLSKLSEPHQYICILLMITLLFLMIVIVACIAVTKPGALSPELGETELKARELERQRQLDTQKFELEKTQAALARTEEEAQRTNALLNSPAMQEIIKRVAEQVYREQQVSPPKPRRKVIEDEQHTAPQKQIPS